MLAHDVAEAMREISGRARIRFDELGIHEDAWDAAYECASNAVNIVKGAIVLEPELIQFGRDLLAECCFKLPFKDVFVAPHAEGFDGILAWQDGEWLQVWLCTNVQISETKKTNVPLPVFYVMVRDVGKDIPEFRTGFVLNPPEHEINKTQAKWPVVLDILLGTVVLMGTKFATVKSELPPDKLNKARERKGKPKINEKIFISLIGKPNTDAQGTHASPSPHWRRGHLRRLADGRIVSVSPTIVAWTGGDKPTPKDYVIKPITHSA